MLFSSAALKYTLSPTLASVITVLKVYGVQDYPSVEVTMFAEAGLPTLLNAIVAPGSTAVN